jgi:hypothetical protein
MAISSIGVGAAEADEAAGAAADDVDNGLPVAGAGGVDGPHATLAVITTANNARSSPKFAMAKAHLGWPRDQPRAAPDKEATTRPLGSMGGVARHRKPPDLAIEVLALEPSARDVPVAPNELEVASRGQCGSSQ